MPDPGGDPADRHAASPRVADPLDHGRQPSPAAGALPAGITAAAETLYGSAVGYALPAVGVAVARATDEPGTGAYSGVSAAVSAGAGTPEPAGRATAGISAGLARWLRQNGVEVGAGLPGPGWLVHSDLGALRRAASQLDQTANDDQPPASEPGELARLLSLLARELTRQADHLEELRRALADIVGEADRHLAGGQSLVPASGGALTLVRQAPDSPDERGHVGHLRRCVAHIENVLADADATDRACAAQVVDIGAQILESVSRYEEPRRTD